MLQKKVNLFGILIDDISIARAMELARNSLFSGECRVFFTPNLEMLEGTRKNFEIKRILNSASVLLPDGDGVLLVSKLMCNPIKHRVAGVDFGEGLISLSEKEKARVFLLGGAKGVAKRAAINLRKKHPNLKICGIHNGYFKDENEIINKIKKANPDVLIVCMGFPKQEKFVYTYRNELSSVKIIACLGGAIDVWAGNKMRAPGFVQKMHLEWLWRITGKPKRARKFVSSLPALFYAVRN